MSSRVTKVLRQASSHSRQFRRHASSSTPSTKPKPTYSLPPEKMRALISLYHQADTFVTKENLSQRIDDAFASPGAGAALPPDVPAWKDLYEEVRKQRVAPKYSEWESERTHAKLAVAPQGGSWSGMLSTRDQKVVEALYGVDMSDASTKAMPGLEVLEEYSGSNEDDSGDLFDKEIEDDVKRRMQYSS